MGDSVVHLHGFRNDAWIKKENR